MVTTYPTITIISYWPCAAEALHSGAFAGGGLALVSMTPQFPVFIYSWQTITRADFGNGATAWADLATKPYYIILNVAIGGNCFTNSPSANTLQGYASSMRVKYVAVYESN